MLNEMGSHLFSYLELVDELMWGYVAIPAVFVFGLYFSTKSRWIQIFKFGTIFKIFKNLFSKKNSGSQRGIRPLNAFFAAIGGCIGIGNIVGVCLAVQIGGPGSVFWMWIGGLLGMIVKYAEIYLGVKYRIHEGTHGYSGGPMYYLQKASHSRILSVLFCILMCIYGVEIYIFRVITQSVVDGWGWNQNLTVVLLLAGVLFAGKKGVDSAGKISSALVPLFLVIFTGVCLWVFGQNIPQFIAALKLIVTSAFTGHAAVGAFAGSTVMLTMANGIKRACYTGDIGIGYASIIHSESAEAVPEKEAALGIFGIFIDTFVICTMSVLLIIVTGLWNQGIDENFVVAQALGQYVPGITVIWPFFIFLLGYSTLIAFFAAGKKSAQFLLPRYGSIIYNVYAAFAFLIFSFVGTPISIMTIMSMTGALLLLLNMYGIFKLKDGISFDLHT